MPRKAKSNLGPGAGSGGKRQGTPGKAYSNRTDLAQDTMPLPEAGTRTPASGGMGQSGEQMMTAADQQRPIYADDFPNLKDPTTRPGVPTATGLPTGPQGSRPVDPRRADAQQVKQYLPMLEPLALDPMTPNSVKQFINFLKAI